MKQLIKFHQNGKLLLVLIALAITGTISAQQFFEDPLIKVKKIDIAEAFNKIEVRGNAVIVLTNNLTNSVVLRGDVGDLEEATARVNKGKLIINASRSYYGTKFIIYLPAGNIHSLATSGNTEILSSGTIKVSDLEILLSGSSHVSIRHEGNLRITPATGYEITDGRK
jgi:Putative auto-transporter adhesin, head GIN domain